MSLPIVAVVGRQNVGKSTLLNRLAGKPLAIVEDYAGTTRDRVSAEVTWNGTSFTLVDTGGLEMRADSTLAQAVKAQAETAIADADVIVFVVDVHDGVVPIDLEIADILRRTEKPVILVANKADRNTHVAAAVDARVAIAAARAAQSEADAVFARDLEAAHDLLHRARPQHAAVLADRHPPPLDVLVRRARRSSPVRARAHAGPTRLNRNEGIMRMIVPTAHQRIGT